MEAWVMGFYFQIHRVVSRSMEPSLLVGDVIHSHVTPCLWQEEQNNCYFPDPRIEPGDIAVFVEPVNQKADYVKRVWAVSGDHLRFDGSDYFLNGKKVKQEIIKHQGQPQDDNACLAAIETPKAEQEPLPFVRGIKHKKFIRFTLPDSGKSFVVQREKAKTNRKAFDWHVPTDHFVVIGDNADHSYDSRDFGPMPMSLIKGKVQRVVFSRADGQNCKGPFGQRDSQLGVRWYRFMMPVR
ncbi:MAG: signal peptidase I [Deltaproteobacteria bacterium]|nr:signal peptidase I [Deltaproteobacteria bacterium]